jgi:hypothetical protein
MPESHRTPFSSCGCWSVKVLPSLNQASERAYPRLVFSVVQSEAHVPFPAADDDGFSGEHSCTAPAN